MVVKNLGIVLGLMGLAWAGCGGDDTNLQPTGTVIISSGSSGAGGSGSGGMGSGTSGSSSSSSGSSTTVYDPNANGPYAILEMSDAQYTNASTGNKVPMRAFYPAGGPVPGPYPVVIVAHGFQIPATQYTNYIKRLATFGYVAITADFPASLLGQDNTKNAKDLISAIEWAGGKSELKANTVNVGMTGHSLGGKLALLAATMDSRVKASIVLDPVDGGGGPGGGCNPPACVDVSALMSKLQIPTGFLGEITDINIIVNNEYFFRHDSAKFATINHYFESLARKDRWCKKGRPELPVVEMPFLSTNLLASIAILPLRRLKTQA
jgi:hypothetical protein